MEPLATYTGRLQCWNSFDYREEGGVPAAQLAVWPDRLEMTTRGALKAVFPAQDHPEGTRAAHTAAAALASRAPGDFGSASTGAREPAQQLCGQRT